MSAIRRGIHSLSREGPSETIRRKIVELGKNRKKKIPRKDEVFVKLPGSTAWLDTATLPMYLAFAGVAVFTKLLMMYDDAHSQELIERRIKKAPPEQGTVRMLTREEWEAVKDEPPLTPFDSSFARPKGRIRSGEPLRMEDLKDWTIDVLTDALTRAEDSVQNSK